MAKGYTYFIDDDATMRKLIEFHAKQRGAKFKVFDDGETAMKAMNDDVECVLTDLNMPGWDGVRCLKYLKDNFPNIPAVVLSGANKIEEAVEAMKEGAVDYITKPFDPDELFAVLIKAAEIKRLKAENRALKDQISTPVEQVEEDTTSYSPAMKRVVKMISKVASVDTTVLLTGESGVGKSRYARLLHAQSKRAQKPFVTVSCPALPRDLLESELFGHKKGAFTGATSDRAGKLEAARGGTLFLDEIGELPIDLQPKLLNVLQDGIYFPVGSEEPVECDIRLITATNIDFEDEIRSGKFREDLYYRLNVFPIEIPPLRDRKDEIKLISGALLKEIAKQRKEKAYVLSKEALEFMLAYDWPGNIRQLRNELERATIIADGGKIMPDDLTGVPTIDEVADDLNLPDGLGGVPLSILEKEAITQTLNMVDGNKSKAARLLQITEKSVYNKVKRYEIVL